ncbi:hypothetical protein TRIUR3_31390 [Triticum urartu]|uniref:Uncharacterized protein n=1 Tax=Triticum urartu TaxID=4572 RepID=M7ZPT5_TRIUA|nr:hypothetical protein TRIUR3_31390 [Triticum urartu]
MEDDGVGVSEGKAPPTRMWRRTWSSRVNEGCGGLLTVPVGAPIRVFKNLGLIHAMAVLCCR